MARPIDSDKFLQDMADLYRQAGWDEREVHFSLADLRSNIGMEDVIPIPQREPDTVKIMADRTTLKIALETDVWMVVYCGEPERLIDVQMRYKDLVAIRKLIVRYCEEQARVVQE